MGVRRNAYIAAFVIESGVVVCFLSFSRPGLALIRAVRALIDNPSLWKLIVSNLNFLGILFVSLSAIAFAFFLLRTYCDSGFSRIAGTGLSGIARDLLGEGEEVQETTELSTDVPKEHPDDTDKEDGSPAARGESETIEEENAGNGMTIRCFNTPNTILLLCAISVISFLVWTSAVFYGSPGSLSIEPVVTLSFLAASGVPWIGPACLAAYLGIRQRKLEQAIISVISRKGFADIEAIVRSTRTAEGLVTQVIAELRSTGIIPADTPIIVTKAPMTSARSSAREP